MNLLNLMKSRHSVRNYKDIKISDENKSILNNLISYLNDNYKTNIQIFYDDPDGFKNSQASYGVFKGCKNYIAMVGKNPEICGYVGAIIALKAQQIGLNTCFVSLTYKKAKIKEKLHFNKKEKLYYNLALGYGENPGIIHKIKSTAKIVHLNGDKPPHFDDVVAACLFAPTALNHQKFIITNENDEIIVKKKGFGINLNIDLGILKAHKDLILGKIKL